MIRTRDFCLFLLTILFLVGGISVSAIRGVAVPLLSQRSNVFDTLTTEVVPVATALSATVPPSTTEPDRPTMLAAMRAKIAELGSALVARTPDPEVVVASSTPAAVEGEPVATAWKCAGFRSVSLPSMLGVQFKITEGARLVYRPGSQPAVVEPTATGTVAVAPAVSSDVVLLQLPLRTAALASPVCIPYDVVGIAIDGSLISNNEQALYAVFGPSTLVGYALDGFPIYGRNDEVVTDRCGGVAAADGYRYYLSSGRESVLGCFAGVPIAL